MVKISKKHPRAVLASRCRRRLWVAFVCSCGLGLLLSTSQLWPLRLDAGSNLQNLSSFLEPTPQTKVEVTPGFLRAGMIETVPASNQSFPARKSFEAKFTTSTQLPDTIPLYSVQSSPILQRHTCIAKIRERHQQAYAPYIKERIHDNDRALLVDPANHKNVGDSMITLAELTLLEKLGYNRIDGPAPLVKQCRYWQAQKPMEHCEDAMLNWAISPSSQQYPTPALWQGGGNWGDLWPKAHSPREKSMEPLLRNNYTVVSMPQSLYFQNPNNEVQLTSAMKGSIARGLGRDDHFLDSNEGRKQAAARVVLSWREHDSYDKAQQLYPFATHILVPDSAFQLGPFSPIVPEDESLKVDIVLFLRDDKESKYMPQRNRRAIQEILSKVPNGKNLSFTIVDWSDRLKLFNSKDILFTKTAIQLMSIGKVVVCDRLHAAILSYLTGIPIVYLDQRTGKTTKTFRVAFELEDGCLDGTKAMWSQALNLTDGIRQAVGFLDYYGL